MTADQTNDPEAAEKRRFYFEHHAEYKHAELKLINSKGKPSVPTFYKICLEPS